MLRWKSISLDCGWERMDLRVAVRALGGWLGQVGVGRYRGPGAGLGADLNYPSPDRQGMNEMDGCWGEFLLNRFR